MVESGPRQGHDATSTEDDAARQGQVPARQDGPTVLAGHSYGGQIMTSVGTDAPNAVALVYVAAQNHEAIPPDAERQFAERMGATTVEVDSGHLAMVTHPARWWS